MALYLRNIHVALKKNVVNMLLMNAVEPLRGISALQGTVQRWSRGPLSRRRAPKAWSHHMAQYHHSHPERRTALL